MGARDKTWIRRPAERRSELLDAAERLFAKRGINATTVADITEAAGVSKGSFYVYFASKDELVDALNARFGDALFAVLDDAVTTEGDVAALLETAVERIIHALLDRRRLLEMWRREPGTLGNATATEWVTRFVERIDPDLTTTAMFVGHGIFGAVLQAVMRDERIDVDDLVKSAQEFATRAFGLTRVTT